MSSDGSLVFSFIGFVVFLGAALLGWVGYDKISNRLFNTDHPDYYRLHYSLKKEHVHVSGYKIDCEFFAAPIGKKPCHYEAHVIMNGVSGLYEQHAVISTDKGETWTRIDDAKRDDGKIQVNDVVIAWEKVADDTP